MNCSRYSVVGKIIVMQMFRRSDRSATDVRTPLLISAEDIDVKLDTARDFALGDLATTRIEHFECIEYIKGIGLLVALFCPTALVVYVIYDSWQTNPSNRSWLILGLGFYIGEAVKKSYESLISLCDRACYLRVEIRRRLSSTLFEAISNALAQAAELDGRTCSRDSEALQEHDPITGDYSVHLGFWSTRPRTIRVSVSVVQAANNGSNVNAFIVNLNDYHEFVKEPIRLVHVE